MSTQTPTFKAILKTRLVFALKMFGFALGFFIVFHWLTGGVGELNMTHPANPPQAIKAAPGTPQYVMDQHRDECWGGNQTPKAELPGAAIVQFTGGPKDGKTVYTHDPKLVDEAFAEALASIGFGERTSDRIDPVALCK